VLSNGVPLWMQDSGWSRELRAFLQEWLGTSLTRACGTDAASRAGYAEALAAAGGCGSGSGTGRSGRTGRGPC
jgi:hypothetical protein